ncbi:MAG: cytochrome d ubiquinol oxidase subunit II [Bacteroidales bacterium]|nr:cytochrome d ubiquinol oxidase subunit II [Bacteroidales bacterium]
MITYEFLQQYWWFLISVLGALLVFLLFVQGGQTLLCGAKTEGARTMMVNSLGRKWELSFTMLVVFGGAFFASFPLFYSTSFGGAYWLWVIILFSFVIQAVSYEYRSKPGNIFGTRTFDTFLWLNGIVGCFMLGVAVSTFFYGAEFTVEKGNLLDASAPVISRWAPTRGLEALLNVNSIIFGLAIVFLARTQGALYFCNNIATPEVFAQQKKNVLYNGAVFVVLFLIVAGTLLLSDGYQVGADGKIETVAYKYFLNFIDMWWVLLLFLVGVVAVLYAIIRTAFSERFTCGIWYSGIGTVLVVLALFFIAGYNNTPYYPSLLDPQSSLTIQNSSSSEFTLAVMSVVSLMVPFVAAYIIYVWYKMDKTPITEQEMAETAHKY